MRDNPLAVIGAAVFLVAILAFFVYAQFHDGGDQ